MVYGVAMAKEEKTLLDLSKEFGLAAGEPLSAKMKKLMLAAENPEYSKIAMRYMAAIANGYAKRAVEYRDKLAETEKKLERAKAASVRDPLTGLYNRRGFDNRWEVIFAKLKRAEDDSVALVYIDLDDFSKFNNDYDHDFGDKALITFSSRLKSLSREEDVVVRYGGDEFVVILGSVKNAENALNILRTRMNGVSVTTDESYEVAVSASYGLCVLTSEQAHTIYKDKTAGEVADIIKKEADAKMMAAKKAGKAARASVASAPPVPEP
jgi:diguanylate cyclase (GGDEF)-like protein